MVQVKRVHFSEEEEFWTLEEILHSMIVVNFTQLQWREWSIAKSDEAQMVLRILPDCTRKIYLFLRSIWRIKKYRLVATK